MNVSVIIPAYNAAKTLADTLKSLQDQTFPHWEAIVIDDGSSDATSVIASQFAHQDRRIRFISQENSGPGVARNTGISLARFAWLLFLDADDLIKPTYFERMTGALEADASLDAVHCGWFRVTPDGTLRDTKYVETASNIFATFTRFCAFAIHSCIVRKAIVEALGGFDPSFRTCEDWDLWQRFARTGARFGAVREVLALYRMRPESLSSDGNQLFTDAIRVITQGHCPDPRVPNPPPDHRQGLPQEDLPNKKFFIASWCAGLILGQGKDARPLLKLIEDSREPGLNPHMVANCLFESVPLSTCQPASAWYKLWPGVKGCIKDFLTALETQSCAPGLARRTGIILERRILHTRLHHFLRAQGISLPQVSAFFRSLAKPDL